jgi:hypothetical protein
MLDCEKGIALALEEVYPLAFHGYCCQHIADNIQTKFGNACRPLFWACARAKNKVTFYKALKALYKQNDEAGDYVDGIPHKYWAQYAFLYPRYSQDTSNIIESLNGTWLRIRNLQPLKLINAIYTTIITTFHNQFHCPYQS